MVTKQTNTVWDCATCAEPKVMHHRSREWVHIRADSLCDDAGVPVPVRLPVPSRAMLDLLDHVYT